MTQKSLPLNNKITLMSLTRKSDFTRCWGCVTCVCVTDVSLYDQIRNDSTLMDPKHESAQPSITRDDEPILKQPSKVERSLLCAETDPVTV